MSTIVRIPYRFTSTEMYAFLGQVFDLSGKNLDTEYTFDFGQLSFIDPIGITTIANTTKLLHEWGVRVYYRNFQAGTSDGVSYLRSVGFFKHFLSEEANVPVHSKPTSFPLNFIPIDAVWDVYDNHFTPWVDKWLNLDSKRCLTALGTSIHEAFNNIKDHSTRNIACFYSQYFPKAHYIIFAISDFGVGIAYNVRNKMACGSDCDAICRAVEDGFSTKSTPRNRGAGLHTIIKNIANNQQGDVKIYSWRGQYEASGENIAAKNIDDESAPYPGTMLAMTLYLDKLTLDEVEGEEVFSW